MGRATLALKHLALGVQQVTQFGNDRCRRFCGTGLLKTRPSCICARVELSLEAPVAHCLANCGFEEIGKRFALAQHSFKVGPQLRLNTHLRKDGRLHVRECVANVLRRQARLCLYLLVSAWARVYFAWRPNLPYEADNHLIEPAVAGAAGFIVTRKLRDLVRGELRFPGLRCLDPASLLKEISS